MRSEYHALLFDVIKLYAVFFFMVGAYRLGKQFGDIEKDQSLKWYLHVFALVLGLSVVLGILYGTTDIPDEYGEGRRLIDDLSVTPRESWIFGIKAFLVSIFPAMYGAYLERLKNKRLAKG
jgi:hypothetical protein